MAAGDKAYLGWNRIDVLVGTTVAGSLPKGELVYFSAGSGQSGSVDNAGQFCGVNDTTAIVGSYATVETEGIFTLTKGNGTAVKIEQGQSLYGSGHNAVATAQVSTGSVIGIAWAQSSSDTSTVDVYIKGMLSKAH